MTKRRLNLYVVATIVVAIFVAANINWGGLSALGPHQLWGFTCLIALGVLSEALWITLKVGGNSGNSSITFIPLLTSVLLFGPASAVVLMFATGLVGEALLRKKPPIKVVFNCAQWVTASGVAGFVFMALGGSPVPTPQGSDVLPRLFPFAAFAVVFLGLNHGAVSGAIAVSEGLPFGKVWPKVVGRSGTNLFYDLLISPIAIGVAILYLDLGAIGLMLALLPLLFIRHSYLVNTRLEEANRNLLKALVKAIETRDPYTSGHSLRVSYLAKDIAERLGLSPSHVEKIETAALLHDIGKIDAGYIDIIRKPSSLSSAERRIIESHVIKGVDLLRSISSFSEEILSDVRHHHEREDGQGYPDGLRGSDIPMGARIIKVCDAIDAMLSDRPYRAALRLDQVRDQLERYAGTQFNHEIVAVVTSSDVLEHHQRSIKPQEPDPSPLPADEQQPVRTSLKPSLTP